MSSSVVAPSRAACTLRCTLCSAEKLVFFAVMAVDPMKVAQVLQKDIPIRTPGQCKNEKAEKAGSIVYVCIRSGEPSCHVNE